MTLIPAAVGINYVAKALAEGLKVARLAGLWEPFFANMLAGPGCIAISGFINNVIYGAVTLSPISTVYAITSIGIGIAVRSFARQGVVLVSATVFVSAIVCVSAVFFVLNTSSLGWSDRYLG